MRHVACSGRLAEEARRAEEGAVGCFILAPTVITAFRPRPYTWVSPHAKHSAPVYLSAEVAVMALPAYGLEISVVDPDTQVGAYEVTPASTRSI